jgi:hypothetical protein
VEISTRIGHTDWFFRSVFFPLFARIMTNTSALRPLAGTELPCYVFDSHQELARHVAQMIAGIVRERQAHGQ